MTEDCLTLISCQHLKKMSPAAGQDFKSGPPVVVEGVSRAALSPGHPQPPIYTSQWSDLLFWTRMEKKSTATELASRCSNLGHLVPPKALTGGPPQYALGCFLQNGELPALPAQQALASSRLVVAQPIP